MAEKVEHTKAKEEKPKEEEQPKEEEKPKEEQPKEEQPKKKPSSSSSSTVLLCLGLLGVLLAVAGYFFVDMVDVRKLFAKHSETPGYYIVGSVPVIHWNSDRKFAKEISQGRKPVILKGTAATKWPAVSKWTPEYLTKNVEILKEVYRHNSKVFTFYDDGKPYVDFEGVHRDLLSSHKITDLHTKDFFEQARLASLNKTSNIYYYYSGPLRDFEDIKDKDVREINFFKTPDGDESFFSVWMGYNGTTAHTHYDIFNNFNLQLYGKKQFILTSPDQWDKMYPFPRHHPSYRQSQVNFEKPDMKKFPNFKGIEAYEAILEPGDVLYIPPYWGHRVTALETSISVNTFSDSSETLAYYEILKTPMPYFQDIKSPYEKAKALTILFHEVVGHSLKEDSKQFIRNLFRVRYAALDALLSKKTKLKGCGEKKELAPKVIQDVNGTAWTVSRSLKRIPRPIRVLSVGNYIEDMLKIFLGIENVAFFLKNC